VRRIAITAGLLGAALAGGCGDGAAKRADEARLNLRTPPPYVAARALPTPTPPALLGRLRDPHPSARDARRLRTVMAGWAAAVRRGDSEAAARFFMLPALVSQPSRGAVEVPTSALLTAFHDSLPCGARLLEVQQNGRYVVGTFRLTERPRHTCISSGQLVRVGFVFGDPAHPRRFTEWWQVPDARGAPPGPQARPQASPRADASSFVTQ
jgi:hypothetical protein